jgi:antitoxin CptB
MTEPPPERQAPASFDVRIKRLTYRAWHRGFREADLILGPYADAHARGMSEADLTAFEFLLTAQDQDLYEWILGRAAPDPAYDGPVLRALQAHVRTSRP